MASHHLLITMGLLLVLTKYRSTCGLELINDKFVYENFQDEDRDVYLHNRFSKGFAWGVATSAYQIEGGWNEGGRGPSIWDTFVHESGNVYMDHTGDVACDSYNKFAEDIEMLKNLGVKYYRFSISWSRLLPDGTLRHPANNDGLQYYHRLIDSLIEADIEPVITLFHFDMPQALQDIGGFDNKQTAQHFQFFADLCFREYGEKVKYWITFNEPYAYVMFGHHYGMLPPKMKKPLQYSYNMAHNMILAHARIWKRYHSKYGKEQQGFVGMTFTTMWAEPMRREMGVDITAANLYMYNTIGWFGHPLYHGDYPEEMKEYIRDHTNITLPKFLPEEREQLLTRSCDFFGVNHYMTVVAKARDTEEPNALFDPLTVYTQYNGSWEVREGFYTIVPWGLRRALQWVDHHYNQPVIFVTENGLPNIGDDPYLEDEDRIKYLTSYIDETLKAQFLDGVDVRGYFAWSLMDNFEWTYGYSMKFGLYYVNFTDPDRPRIPRKSAKVYAQIIEDNGLPSKTREDL